MYQTETRPDSRYGGSMRPTHEPISDNIPKCPDIDLQPLYQRWSLMRLEYMSKWFQKHRDISRFINPKRGFFEGMLPNYNQQFDFSRLMDGDPAHYSRLLAVGMVSGLTSPSSQWFRLGMQNDTLQSEAVQMWLEYCERLLFAIFAKSNIYEAFQQTYEELGLFGTGAFGIYEDFENVIHCRSYTSGEYYLSVDHTGRVNGFARQFWLTVAQVVKQYGWENCSDKVKNAYRSRMMDTWIMCYSVVEANDSKISGYEDFKGMPFRSVTWEANSPDNRALEIKGFNEFPVMAPRWETTTTADIYGDGPGLYVLGDVKSLYRMTKDLFLTTNKISDPPMVADAGMENINALPGGLSRKSNSTSGGLQPAFQIQGDPITPITALADRTLRKIASRFYADLFMMMIGSEKNDMTAREVAEKHSEKMVVLGPVLSKVKKDMLSVTITRTFNIAFRAGIIPPPPPEIQGQPIKIEYIGLLAQAQKMVESQTIERETAFVMNMAQAYPEALDVINIDEAIREHAEYNGAPRKIIRGQDEVAAIRQQRAQAQAQQQQMANIQMATDAAHKLSQTQVGGKNALEHITGAEGSDNAA